MIHMDYCGKPLCNTKNSGMQLTSKWEEVKCKRCLRSKEKFERKIKNAYCFGCGKWYNEREYGGKCNFSIEWDTWCHSDCCPADIEECKICEHGGADE